MTTYLFPVPASLRGERLRAEVEAAVGGPVGVSVTVDGLGIIVPDGTEEAEVAAVIAAHDGSPDVAEQAELDSIAGLRDEFTGLRQYHGLASPTAAQTAQATKALIRVLRVLLRDED